MASSQYALDSYLNEIGRHPILTKEAQLRHCRAIHAWVNYPGGKEAAPSRVARAGRHSMNVMVTSNMRLVVSIAKRYQNRGLDITDLIQEGALGMIRSLELYDPTRGYAFTTYAYWWIRQSINRAIHLYSRTIRLPVSSHETVSTILKYISTYSSAHGKPPSTEQIAEKLKITPERVRQILDAYALTTCCSLDRIVRADGDDPLVQFVANDNQTSSYSPEAALFEQVQQEELEYALHDLSEVERYIIEQQYIKRQSIQALSKELGLSKNKVLALRDQALESMRNLLSAMGVVPQ